MTTQPSIFLEEINTRIKSPTNFIIITGSIGSGKTEYLRHLISEDEIKHENENGKIKHENDEIKDKNEEIKKKNKKKERYEQKSFFSFKDEVSDYVTINSKSTVAFKGCKTKALERLQDKINDAKKHILLIDDLDLLLAKFPDVLFHLLTRSKTTISTSNSTSLDLYQFEVLSKKICFVNMEDFTHSDTFKYMSTELIDDMTKNITISDEDIEFIISASKMFLPDFKLPHTPVYLFKTVISNLSIGDITDITITQDNIVKVLKDFYNIDLTKKDILDIKNKSTSTEHSINLKTLSDDLEKIVIGQTDSIKTISKTIKRSYVGFSDNHKPKGSFLILGQTGVGKTETAKALAKEVYGNSNNMIRFDMSEYHHESRIHNLIGSSRGYVAYEEGGELTNAVAKGSKKVILFDEVEKAHPKVFDILLQLLDEGRLTDSKGVTYSYADSIIIMTSNLKGEEFKEFFRPEFLNRLDNTLHFNELELTHIHSIFDKLILDTIQKVENKGFSLTITPNLKSHVCNIGFDPSNGARPLQRAINSIIEDEIIEAIIDDLLEINDNIILDFQNGEVKLFTTTNDKFLLTA